MLQNDHIDWLTLLGLYETRYIIYGGMYTPEGIDEIQEAIQRISNTKVRRYIRKKHSLKECFFQRNIL